MVSIDPETARELARIPLERAVSHHCAGFGRDEIRRIGLVRRALVDVVTDGSHQL